MTEQRAPRTKERVVQKAICTGETGSAGLGARTYAYRKKISAAKIADMAMIVRFCRERKASAPSLMASDISRIFGVPVSRASTQRARKTANPSDKKLTVITNATINPPLPYI